MRVFLAIVIGAVGCGHSWTPGPSGDDDPSSCLSSGEYAVRLVLDHSECSTTPVGNPPDPFGCPVASLDPQQVLASYQRDQLDCSAPSDVRATWTIESGYPSATDDEIAWDPTDAVSSLDFVGATGSSTLMAAGSAEDRYGRLLTLIGEFDIFSPTELGGRLTVTFTDLYGGRCDESYLMTASQ